MPNRLGVFPGVPAVEIQVGLMASTQDHAKQIGKHWPTFQYLIRHHPRIDAGGLGACG
jgi:hypothetical protein